MTAFKTHKANWGIALGIPLIIFLSCYIITFSSKFKINNALLSNGILIDLIITAPAIYFLAIRKSSVSKLTVIRVFVAGLLFASFILKSHSNILLQIVKTWISPAIELFLIIIISRKFYVANKSAKSNNKNSVDFLMHSRSMIFQVTGNEKLGNIIASEISVIYYAFFCFKNKSIDYKTRFSSYRENSLPIVLWAILSIFLIETLGVHFLLNIWNKTLAWSLTALNFYTCLQLFAHIKALKARPVAIHSDSFEVHNGLAGDANIRYDNIEKIEISNKIPKDRKAVKISLFKGLENHNVIVYLNNSIEVTKIFGIKKRTDTVLFFVDKPKEFLNSLSARMMEERAEH